jgi:NhaP-type Na+/H+ and K+/H+ antiporter
VPPGARPEQSVGQFLRARLHGRPAVGDSLRLDRVCLTVRQAAGGTIRRVGLRLVPREAPPSSG